MVSISTPCGGPKTLMQEILVLDYRRLRAHFGGEDLPIFPKVGLEGKSTVLIAHRFE